MDTLADGMRQRFRELNGRLARIAARTDATAPRRTAGPLNRSLAV